MRIGLAIVGSTALIGLAGCSLSDSGGQTPSAPRSPSSERIDRAERLAYVEMQALSRRTCAAVPRKVLWKSLSATSSDPSTASGSDDDNGIALLFAEDVRIQGIPLQRAAYDGCLAGLEAQP